MKNWNFFRGRQGHRQCHGQGHIERKIFGPFQIRHKKVGLLYLKKIEFDLKGHLEGHF